MEQLAPTPTLARPPTPKLARPPTPKLARPPTPTLTRPPTPTLTRPSTPTLARPPTPTLARPTTIPTNTPTTTPTTTKFVRPSTPKEISVVSHSNKNVITKREIEADDKYFVKNDRGQTVAVWEIESDIIESFKMFREWMLSQSNIFGDIVDDTISVKLEELELYRRIYQEEDEAVKIFGPYIAETDYYIEKAKQTYYETLFVGWHHAKIILVVDSYWKEVKGEEMEMKPKNKVPVCAKIPVPPPTLRRPHEEASLDELMEGTDWDKKLKQRKPWDLKDFLNEFKIGEPSVIVIPQTKLPPRSRNIEDVWIYNGVIELDPRG